MKLFCFLLSLVFLISCNNSKPRIEVVVDENLSQVEIDSIIDEFSFKYDRLDFIDSTNIVLFPISTQIHRGNKFRSGNYKSNGYPNHWNILFYNHKTGTTNLLTEDKVNIIDFRTNMKYFGSSIESSILYSIKNTDYNKDSKLNSKDPTYLFISKNDGSQLTRISPKNEHVEDYTIIPKTDKIIIKTRRDNNHDLEFDTEDDVIWYQVNTSEEINLHEIIKSKERKKIETLYFKQWLVKKE